MSPRYGFLKILIDKRKKVIINPETRLSEENFTLRQSCDFKKNPLWTKKSKAIENCYDSISPQFS